MSAIRTPEAQDPLEVGEQHLDFLPPTTGLHVFRSRGVRTSHIAGVFIKVSRNLAGDRVRTALRFEFADIAIQFAGAIESCALGCDAAPWGRISSSELNQFFACRAGVTVALGVKDEIGPGERAICSI
jgi:hypothetical protein